MQLLGHLCHVFKLFLPSTIALLFFLHCSLDLKPKEEDDKELLIILLGASLIANQADVVIDGNIRKSNGVVILGARVNFESGNQLSSKLSSSEEYPLSKQMMTTHTNIDSSGNFKVYLKTGDWTGIVKDGSGVELGRFSFQIEILPEFARISKKKIQGNIRATYSAKKLDSSTSDPNPPEDGTEAEGF